MVGGGHEAVLLHPLDVPRRTVVADSHLPLQPAGRRLLALRDDLDRLAEFLFLGAVVADRRTVQREAVLGFLGDRLDVFWLALRAPVVGDRLDLIVADEGPVDADDALAAVRSACWTCDQTLDAQACGGSLTGSSATLPGWKRSSLPASSPISPR